MLSMIHAGSHANHVSNHMLSMQSIMWSMGSPIMVAMPCHTMPCYNPSWLPSWWWHGNHDVMLAMLAMLTTCYPWDPCDHVIHAIHHQILTCDRVLVFPYQICTSAIPQTYGWRYQSYGKRYQSYGKRYHVVSPPTLSMYGWRTQNLRFECRLYPVQQNGMIGTAFRIIHTVFRKKGKYCTVHYYPHS
jgi:hypothetical protein